MREPPDNENSGPGGPAASTPSTGSTPDQGSPEQDNRNQEVALETASGGWPVFPCWPTTTDSHKAKAPVTHNGFKDATTSPHQIEAWWDGHPEYLVATPTEGLIVVDLDEPHNRPPTGETWAWWCRFAEPHGWDPTVAPLVATPRGGYHIYWRQPDGVTVRNSASKLAPGVDIRADGGYVIVPGSRLPDGREYELLQPFPAKLVDAPPWLIEACNRTDTPEKVGTAVQTSSRRIPLDGTRFGLQALDAELGRLATTPEGQRNHALNRAAFKVGQLVAGGQLESHYANDQLEAVALRIGLQGGERGEVALTIKSGMTNGALHPRRPTP
jgi:putative DNA primase/helicase